MAKYQVLATRETYYEFEIEADTPEEAQLEMERIEIEEDVEEYAYDWYPLEVTSIEEVEDQD